MEKKKRQLAYIFIAPASIWLLVFIGYPIFQTLRTSLYRTTYLGDKFAWFLNYRTLLQDDVFHLVLRNSIIWTVAAVAINVILGLLVALLLRRPTVIGELSRATLVLAWATPFVVVAIVWKWMYNGEYGQLNSLLLRLHLIEQPVSWLTNATSAFIGALIARFWSALPFNAFAFLSGLQSIPVDLYEASMVDGANSWQRFWKITLPLLKPVTTAILLVNIIWSFNSFAFIYVMTGGGPANRTQIIVTEIYRRAFGYSNYGEASALAVIALVFLLTITFIQWKLFYREQI